MVADVTHSVHPCWRSNNKRKELTEWETVQYLHAFTEHLIALQDALRLTEVGLNQLA